MQQTHQETMPKTFEIPYPQGKLVLNRVLIMGIINVTPDSFSDGGKFYKTEAAVSQALSMLDQGAGIIDIGGESTRPGAKPVSLNEELKRVIPVIQKVTEKRPDAVISIDTYKSEVAKESILAGASMVNDISGLGFDENMKEVIFENKVPVIIMHIKGTPRNMQNNPHYENLTEDLKTYFQNRISLAKKAGIGQNQIIIDPGIGFGKRLEDNYEILQRLDEFTSLGYPILVGPSRKSFIGKVLDLPEEKRLYGTAASVAISVIKGANIIRVHDVKEMNQVIKVAERIKASNN